MRTTVSSPISKARDNAFSAVGNTPLVQIEYKNCSIWAKCEYRNPTGSVKDRLASVLVREASEHLPCTAELVDVSSGTYWRSLMFFAWMAGNYATVFVPYAPHTLEQKEASRWGGRLVRSGPSILEAINAAKGYANLSPNRRYLGQFDRTDSTSLFRNSIASEILAVRQRVSNVVAVAGTGALLTGLLDAFGPSCNGYIATSPAVPFCLFEGYRNPLHAHNGRTHCVEPRETFLSLAKGIASESFPEAGSTSTVQLAVALQLATLSSQKEVVVILTDSNEHGRFKAAEQIAKGGSDGTIF